MGKTVGIRDLKTRLGTYLRLVREGATLIVTDRGRPIAELRPLSHSAGEDLDAVIEDMIALGEVSRPSSGPIEPFEPISVRGAALSRTVIEDREDRF